MVIIVNNKEKKIMLQILKKYLLSLCFLNDKQLQNSMSFDIRTQHDFLKLTSATVIKFSAIPIPVFITSS